LLLTVYSSLQYSEVDPIGWTGIGVT